MPKKTESTSKGAPKPQPAPKIKLTPAQKTQKRRDSIPGLVLFDDVFMNQVFLGNIPAAQCLINVILGREDLRVVRVEVQHTISNLFGYGVRLDIYCEDEAGKLYDIEVQNPSEGAHPKRARYNSAAMDTSTALIADKFENLPETYVIFITREDYFGKGDALYWFDRMDAKHHMQFGDETHIIYVNGAYKGNDPVGKLIHDFHCTSARDMNYKDLAERVHYLKETEEGREKMCKVMQDLIYDEVYDALVDQKIREIQKAMDRLHYTFEEAYDYAEVDDDIAPAVLDAFGMKSA